MTLRTGAKPGSRRRWRPRIQLFIPGAPDFPLLWGAASASFLGDGISAAALPLLAAGLSGDPAVVAAVVAVSWLPWLLFALPAGALIDAWDRKRVMWLCDLVRFGLMAALAGTILLGVLTVPVLMVLGFLLAAAAVLFEGSSVAVLPTMLSRDPRLVQAANSRLMGAQITAVDFLGPPVGGLLFSWSRALPFCGDALSFAISSVLIRRMRGDYRVTGTSRRDPLLASLRRGLVWLWRQPVLRSITAIAGLFNLASTAQAAILVLFAQQMLGLGPVGFSLLLAVSSVGSLAGSFAAGPINRRLHPALTLRLTLLGAGAASVLLGVTSNVWMACGAKILGGFSIMSLNIIQVSLRQTCTPDDLLGRVNGVHKVVTYGAMPFGAMLGGILATLAGLRACYLVGGGLIAALSLVAAGTITRAGVTALTARSSSEPTD